MSVRRSDLTEKWYEYVYRERSERVRRFVETYPDERSLSVSYDRFGHDYQFVRPLLSNPDEVLRAGRDALGQFLSNDETKFDAAYLRVNDLPDRSELSLAELRAEHLNELHSLRCTVVGTGPVRPKVVVAAFRCAKCERVTRRVAQPGRAFREHAKCPRCNSVGYITFEPEDSEYVDAQTVEVSDGDGGNTDADRVEAFLEHDLAGTVEAGDGVRLVGIPRAERTGETTVADRWVEAVSMEHLTT